MYLEADIIKRECRASSLQRLLEGLPPHLDLILCRSAKRQAVVIICLGGVGVRTNLQHVELHGLLLVKVMLARLAGLLAFEVLMRVALGTLPVLVLCLMLCQDVSVYLGWLRALEIRMVPVVATQTIRRVCLWHGCVMVVIIPRPGVSRLCDNQQKAQGDN